jgi:hexokinase
MIPTFVFGWPTGKETGDFLALDLGVSSTPIETCSLLMIYCVGGTNLRVCLVTLHGEGKFEITQSKYRLTEEQKQEDGQKLFDFCAECLKLFLEQNLGSVDGEIPPAKAFPLGFTVSSSG